MAVIINEELDNKYLVAYYVAEQKLDEQEIKDYLAEKLPDYMIPSIFIHMHNLPFTKNGKLDRKALPKSEFTDKNSYVAPKNKQERIVCEAFTSILNLQQVGVNEDFFSLGGNSIQAIKLVSILQTNFDIKIADIFNLRTPRKLAQNSIFGKNFLQQKLELVKFTYQAKQNNNKPFEKNLLQNCSL